MGDKWKIFLYDLPSGNSPVRDFIESLEEKARSKIYSSLELLKEFGLLVGPPHVKKLVGTELWELRILGQDSIRIFYVAISGKTFLILHCFLKKKQKTDLREIKVATERLKEHRNRKENRTQ